MAEKDKSLYDTSGYENQPAQPAPQAYNPGVDNEYGKKLSGLMQAMQAKQAMHDQAMPNPNQDQMVPNDIAKQQMLQKISQPTMIQPQGRMEVPEDLDLSQPINPAAMAQAQAGQPVVANNSFEQLKGLLQRPK